MFDSITEELADKQQSLNAKLSSLTNANFGFLTTISYLLDLAQHANQLFKDADVSTKNKLLRLVLPANSILYDKKLVCNVFYPYKAVQELNDNGITDTENTNWCSRWVKVYT